MFCVLQLTKKELPKNIVGVLPVFASEKEAAEYAKEKGTTFIKINSIKSK